MEKRRTYTPVSKAKKEGDKRATEAILYYEALKSADGLNLVKMNLHTGRSHQIRAQMALAGHPLYGDQKYGSRSRDTGERISLWSAALAFMHPVKGERMIFKADPPPNNGDGSIDGTVLLRGQIYFASNL